MDEHEYHDAEWNVMQKKKEYLLYLLYNSTYIKF